MKKQKRGQRIMRKLTPMQLETLTYFYYGEVNIRTCTRLADKSRSYHLTYKVFTTREGLDISGRVGSLRKRKLLKCCNTGANEAVILTHAGIKEMEAIDA